MRRNIVHIGAGELAYAIREIVEQAGRLEALGVTMAWENIGDPVQKGERIPDWIKQEATGTPLPGHYATAQFY